MNLRKIKLVYRVMESTQSRVSVDKNNFKSQSNRGFIRRNYRHNLNIENSRPAQVHTLPNQLTNPLINQTVVEIYKIELL